MDEVIVSVDDIVVGEASGFAEFVVRLNRPAQQEVIVQYNTESGTADTQDYNSSGTQTLVFAAGETQKTVRITLRADTQIDPLETFYLNLFEPSTQSGVSFAHSRATATIVDNDTLLATPLLSVSGATVDEAAGVANFVLTLNGRSNSEISMLVSTLGGTATAGSDFAAITNQRVTFAPGQTAVTVSVPILNDNVAEFAETLSLVVSGLTGATVFQNTATAIISQSDQPAAQSVVVHVDDVVVSEGSAFAEFVVRLDKPSTNIVEVFYSTQSGTADTLDYNSSGTQSLVFAAGETLKTVRIPLQPDTSVEAAQTFYLTFFQPQNQTGVFFEKSLVSATIVDNDTLVANPLLTVSNVVVDEAAGVANFVLSLNARSSSEVTLTVSTVNGTALGGVDFAAIENQRVSFAPGQTSVTISVPVFNDNLLESSEAFSLVVSNLTGATVFDNVATATIGQSDQLAPQIVQVSVDDIVVSEGSPYAEFVVRLDNPASNTIGVFYSLQSGTADTLDYDSPGTELLVFAAGETIKTIRVPILADTRGEFSEVFYLVLSEPENQTGVNLEKSLVSATIVDNDTLLSTPVLSVSGAVVDEAAGFANFVLTLNGRSSSEITMLVSTLSGTAVDGQDYTGFVDQKVSFAPGQTAVTVSVPLLNDNVLEAAESFSLVVSNLVGATAFQNSAVATIEQNDQAVAQTVLVKVDDVVVSEGSAFVEFVLRLDNPSFKNFSVSYSTQSGVADTLDFDPAGTQFVTFMSGETVKTIRVPIEPDTNIEPNETFYISLGLAPNQTGVLLEKTLVSATIVDNDSLLITPVLSISNVIVDEQSSVANFVLTLNGRSNNEVTMLVSTQNGTATGGQDFAELLNQRVSFAPGQTSVTISVPILKDSLAEIAESFSLVVSELTGASTLQNTAVATIAANDQVRAQTVMVVVDEIVVSEGSPFAEFVLRLSNPSVKDIAVFYSTQSGVADTLDFDPVGTQQVVFVAGETVKTIRVPIEPDSSVEPAEAFYLRLSQPSEQTGVILEKSLVTATIVDNDSLVITPVLSISSLTVDEAAGVANFVLTLNARSNNEVSMLVSTQNGTATAGADFTALVNQRVSFAPGQTAVTVSVPILNDNLTEIEESFSLVVSSLTGATAFQTSGIATIGQSDQVRLNNIVASIEDVIVGEGSPFAEFVVRLNAPSVKDIQLFYSAVSGTANTLDFDPAGTQSIVLLAGETVKTFRIPLEPDTTAEFAETWFVALNQPSQQTGVFLERSLVSATIVDNDTLLGTPQVSIRDVFVDEAEGVANFVITLSGRSNNEVSMVVSTRDGIAKAGQDYTAVTGQKVSFAPGQTAVTISVPILNDAISELAEMFSLEVSDVQFATISDSVATAEIAASDFEANQRVRVFVQDVLVSESEPFAEFVVQLNRPSTQFVTLEYFTSSLTASSFNDYSSLSRQVMSFAPGETVNTVRVPLLRDNTVEQPETFELRLAVPAEQQPFVTLSQGFARATIIDSSMQVPVFNPTGPATVFNGTFNNDSFRGTNGNDIFSGGAGNDVLELSGGRDAFNGGSGRDTLVTGFSLAGFDFAISGTDPETRVVTMSDYSIGVETALTSVERIAFSDFGYAFDFENEQSAGGVYRVYQAAFNRRPDLEGLGFWISKADLGVSIDEIAKGFVYSAEFERVYDLKLNDDFASGQDVEKIVTTFYNNVLGRVPEQEGFNFWVNVLSQKADTVANVLADFSNSIENRTNLIGVLQDGFEFTPFLG